ncbi:tetratricopeptide repeat protein [Caulifigura coniformis]|uniref:tetratricopeptide repeat protein n=1 Tax=Caulifigura coniformis TaxID=2527983 RepID=UPI001E5BC327|nr:tetratricopeptide repeat protein [Caulifigura coniformis]
MHRPGQRPGGLQVGNRPQINPGGGITRPDLTPGGRPSIGGGNARPNLPGHTAGIGGHRPENLPGLANRLPDHNTATLPGLGPNRPGQGGAGERFQPGNRPGDRGPGDRGNNNIANRGGDRNSNNNIINRGGDRNSININGGDRNININRPGAGGAGTRWTPGESGHIADRHNDLSNRFDEHWGDSDWHHQQWNGPNGGEINHVGFWGPNGYWGHTGAWGPNGGHWGHSTGIGPNGAWGHTVGWGPNGNVWGHGGAIGPNGAFGWAGYSGPPGHWSRNWGGWYNGYAPAWGYGRWDYLWNNYPVAMAFGATMWGINAANWMFGVGGYYNPYYSSGGGGYVDYSQPIVGDPSYMVSDETVDQSAAVTTDAAAPADPVTTAFDQARDAFKSDQFQQALDLTSQALKTAPRDAAINEFRGLCLFALGQYRDAAATIHPVLAAGPGWDWTTMISLYSNADVYTEQVRKLENAIKADPQPDAEFLLAYHYITQGHKDDAVALLEDVVKRQPKDELAAELVKMYAPESSTPPAASSPVASSDNVKDPAWPIEKLQATWTAKDDGGTYLLMLNKDDSFTWEFSRDGKPQKVSGAYVVRGNNLVMQPDSGGVMLSEIDLQNATTLSFSPLGDSKKLTFSKS